MNWSDNLNTLIKIWRETDRKHFKITTIFTLFKIQKLFLKANHLEIIFLSKKLIKKGEYIGYFYLARSNFLRNNLHKAKNNLEKFLINYPTNEEAIYLIAEIYLLLGNKALAQKYVIDFLPYSKRRKIWQILSNLVQNNKDLLLFKKYFNQKFLVHSQLILTYDLICHYSNALIRSNNIEYALDLWRKQYKIYSKNANSNKHKSFTLKKYSNRNASIALEEIKNCLDKYEIPFFLISGTLLGCIRENKLLSNDKDIDLGVWENISINMLITIFRNQGSFYILPQYSENLLVIRHVNGITIDIFIHHRNKNDYWHGGGKCIWHNTPFKLTEYPFLGKKYLIPENYELYLSENYGDWKKPKIEFDSALDTENMSILSTNLYLIYIYKKIVFSLSKKEPPSKRYIDILEFYNEKIN